MADADPSSSSSPPKTNFGVLLIAAGIGYLMQLNFGEFLMPFGMPQPNPQRGDYAPFQCSSADLPLKHGKTRKISNPGVAARTRIRGVETVTVHPTNGTIFLMNEAGSLLELSGWAEDPAGGGTAKGNVTFVRDLGAGRPMAGRFSPFNDYLYITDAVLGLTRVKDVRDPHCKLEVVATTVVDDNGEVTKFRFVNALDIGPKSGKVYFVDASAVHPERIGKGPFDLYYPAKVTGLLAKGSGRVLEYDPVRDHVRVLAQDLLFANGISVDKDESFLVISESLGPRFLKYHLAGPKAGELETLVDRKQMMGYSDGGDCDFAGSGKCYAVLASAIVPVQKFLAMIPDSVDLVLRMLMLSLPRQLAPPATKVGAIVEIDPTTKEVRYFCDQKGEDISELTGVTLYNGKLYLGSVKNDYVAVYEL